MTTDDFDDVEALIGDALLHKQARERKKPSTTRDLNRRVHDTLDGQDSDLEALLNEALDKREWITTHAVVLVHVQHCSVCATEHSWCEGWFTRQKHRTDSYAMRLLKGRPVGAFPSTVERQLAGQTAICAACAESQIAIEVVFGADNADHKSQ